MIFRGGYMILEWGQYEGIISMEDTIPGTFLIITVDPYIG